MTGAGRLTNGPLLTTLGVTRRRLRHAAMNQAERPDAPRPTGRALPAPVRFDFGWLDDARAPRMHTMVVRPMTAGDVDGLAATSSEPAPQAERQRFRRRLAEQAAGERLVLVAESDGVLTGHVGVRWRSGHPPFRTADIPEIVDLVIVPAYRRQGVATMLLEVAEATVATRSSVVGIGVGLHAECGPAQRLYAKRGYLPDGRGAHRAGRPVPAAATVRLDDAVSLMLVKRIR